MKCIDISFDFDAVKVNQNEREVIIKKGFGAVFEPFLNQAISSKYPQGLNGSKGRILNRIQNALDSMKPEDKYLKVEEAEFDLIKEVFFDENTKFQPIQFRLVTTLLDSIEKAAVSKCCTKTDNSCETAITDCATEAAN